MDFKVGDFVNIVPLKKNGYIVYKNDDTCCVTIVEEMFAFTDEYLVNDLSIVVN